MIEAVIEQVAVVVPARNEEALLPACLASIQAAVEDLQVMRGLPAHVVVVLDACTDDTAGVVAEWAAAATRSTVHALRVAHRNVGLARASGVACALRHFGMEQAAGRAPERLWIASTDADSTVPVGWLRNQVELADRGAEAVVGTVTVADWRDRPEHLPRLWTATYRPRDDHGHVHGANLGCTGAAYLRAGGFPALATGEDVALVRALEGAGVVVRSADFPVVTSARRVARAPHGFAGYLSALADSG